MSGQFPGMILADADFMIHGVFRYTLFGQELYITTTHVAMFIVTIIILIIMICAHHTMKHAKQIPGTYNLCDALPGISKYPIVRLCDVPHTDSPLIPRHTIKIILPPKPYSMQEKKKSGRWTDSGFLSLFIISLYDR